MGSKELLRMAKDLDEMTKDVLPEEADLLDEALKRLLARKSVPAPLSESIRKMHDKYLAPKDEEEPASVADADGLDPEDEEIEE